MIARAFINTLRGNVTGTTSYANAAAQTGPVTASMQYDIAGNIVATVEGRAKISTISYADSFCNGVTCGGTFTPNTFAFATSATSPVPDPTGQYASATALVTISSYDFWTKLVTSTTDANNQTTSIQYNDLLDRPTQVSRAVGTAAANQTTFGYDDTNRVITTTIDRNSFGDNILKTKTVHDGMGRAIETRQYESSTDYIAVRNVPFVVLQDGTNWLAASQSSNPFRPYLAEQPVWTTSFFDSLSRSVKVKTPDNAVITTSYSGNTVTVTDQALKVRRSITDSHRDYRNLPSNLWGEAARAGQPRKT